MAKDLIHEGDLRQLFERCRRIAVLGAHLDPSRPAFYVPNYMFHQGYEIYGVNPEFVGEVVWGRPVVARLVDLPADVDIVNIFRNPMNLGAHLPELLAMAPPPRAVWMQTGITHTPVARGLMRAGIDVVQDRCMMVEHRQLLAGSRVWS